MFCANVYFFNCKTLGQKTVSEETLGQKYVVSFLRHFIQEWGVPLFVRDRIVHKYMIELKSYICDIIQFDKLYRIIERNNG